MKKIGKMVLLAAAAALGGCSTVGTAPRLPASGPQKLYLEAEYDRGLIDGPNTVVDVGRLLARSTPAEVDESDQYAIEVAATTKFSVLKAAAMEEFKSLSPRQVSGYDSGLEATNFGKLAYGRHNYQAQRLSEPQNGRNLSPIDLQKAVVNSAWAIINQSAREAGFPEFKPWEPMRNHQRRADSWGPISPQLRYEGCFELVAEAVELGGNSRLRDLFSAGKRNPFGIWSPARCGVAFEVFPTLISDKLKQPERDAQAKREAASAQALTDLFLARTATKAK